jgi:hypothetical protein
MTESSTASPTDQTHASTPATSGSSKGTLLGMVALLLVAAVSGWAAYIYVTGTDGFSWKRFAFQNPRPNLVKYTGRILFNGKPLSGGFVMAYEMEKNAPSAMGQLDKDGRFSLMTDVDGYKEGCRPGKYKLVVNVNYPSRPVQFSPDPMLPPEYYDPQRTPVEIEVSSDPEQNVDRVLRLEGELLPPPKAKRPRKGKNQGKSKKQPADPAARLEQMMKNDKNGDGKLSPDEVTGDFRRAFDLVDKNKDGYLDSEELKDALGIGRR